MDWLSTFAPPAIAGLLGLLGIALKVWSEGRDRRRRGQREVDAGRAYLDFAKDWLAVRDAAQGTLPSIPIPTSLSEDLSRAYRRVALGTDQIADATATPLLRRIAAALVPPSRVTSTAGGIFKIVYWLYFAMATVLFIAIVAAASQATYDPTSGPLVNFLAGVVAFGVLLSVTCIGPLAWLRYMVVRSEKRSRATVRREAAPGGPDLA